MGKKVSKTEKHEVRGLMKVLRPKVYITDSSSFKKLVQELTGDGGMIITSPNPRNVPLPLQMQEAAEPTLSIQDYAVDYSETSMEASADSLQSSQSYNPTLYTNGHDDVSDEGSSRGQEVVDLKGYRDIESWLLDMESFGHNCYNPITWDQLGTDVKLSLFFH